MHIRTFTKVFLLGALLTAPSFAKSRHQASGAIPQIPKTEGIDFAENKGQWVEQAKFRADVPGGAVFITNQGFVYNYIDQKDLHRIHELTHEPGHNLSNEIIHYHAYKVNFSGANTAVQYTNDEKRSHYNNYYIGNDPSKWASNVHLYGKVTQKNVYQGVDVSIYSQKGSLKYDFVVAPGADAAQIALTFDGVQPQLTAEGHLKLKTSVNEIIEQAPYTYQVIDGKETPVKSKYKLNRGKLSFEFPEGYNHQAELVIDPILVFATYSGGTSASNYSDATTYDQAGNLYAGAYAYGLGWPVTTGAYQTTFGGGSVDAAINKYNALGSALVFSTFYGGSGNDLPHAMIVNEQNELILVGSTTSSNLPVPATAYDASLGGSTDIFVAHFNATATSLIGATYMGGSGSEPTGISFGSGFFGLQSQNTTSPVEVNFDDAGNIWVVSSTPSNDFPVTANAQQATYGGGSSDGVLFKLNPACSNLLYSSYLGGTGADAINGIKFNSSNNLVICGATQSTNFPTTAGALHTTAPGGVSDGFVSIVNAATGAIAVSTFVGTIADDQAVNLDIDEGDNIFVLGRTLGDYPISAGVYNMPNTDVFIDKLNPTLTTSLKSTRVGNPQNSSNYFPTAFLHDVCGNTYVAGLNAVADMPTTGDAFQTQHARFWFVVLQPNFSDILFGSYFGALVSSGYPDHTHVGVNRLDPEGVVYHSVCANAPTGTFPTTAGSYAPAKLNSAGQDIISYKFDFEATGVNSDFKLDPTISANDTGCAPYTVKFHNTSTSSETYIWDFGDNTTTSTDTNPTHIFVNPGVYTVTLYAHADSSCITDDTAYMTITVLKTELPDIVVNDTTLCSFQQSIPLSVHINNPSANNTILWQPGTGILSNPTLPQITVDPSVNNLYYVTVKDTIPGICGFSVTDTIHIDLAPRQLDIINNDTVVCEGAMIPLTVIGTPGYTYKWTPSTGVSDTTLLNPTLTIHQPNIYTIRASHPGCEDTLVSINIGMHYIPTVELGPNKAFCQWTEVALESVVTPYRPDYIYQWSPSGGLNTPTGPNADLVADTSGTWYLDVKTPIGCAARDSIKLTVYPGNFGAAATDTGYCPPSEVQLWATGGVSYSWTPSYGLNDTGIANPLASPATTTDYTVYIKDIHNCLDTQKLTVTVYPLGVLALPDSINVYPGEAYQVAPNTNALYFQWFPASGVSNPNIADPTLSPEVRTRYFVTARTEHGCVVTDSMDVLVKETELDMPNAFAPGGTNNLFKPTKRGIAQLKSFTIFNRWGNKVYSSTNIDEGWDGTYKGAIQPMGVYMYVIEAVTDKGRPFTKQGNVTLIR
ncbi:gliding motility-associated C-terminal domain-containing protein [Taibaiella chishuiensis]|uniref:Gliding motility-associated-like protein n=1 Tax=Taibaiella chishuiensis TaxID=1434707 RepID=A0A2P8CVR3_9BACT|nr:gliding motility-associated C-terminal domain-containing protein [Taibaiella chishuiensis]PSK89040.1 gliding motility-associated-like protein [Taibaiella chishuiensis]